MKWIVMKPSKYYKISVTLKNGFFYSFTTSSRSLKGHKQMLQESHWTDKLEEVEITKEEHENHWNTFVTDEPVVVSKKIPKATKADMKKLEEEAKKPKERNYPQFSSLENFFGDENEKPTRTTKKRSSKRV
jgi:hypothetical protein